MKEKLDFSQPLMVLAPLAGYTDLPFRTVVKKFGADLTISEMISSNALVYKSEKTLKMIEKSPSEDPYFVQIAGNKPELVRDAVLLLNEIDGIDGIDLNCGCPAPKVFNHGSGSNLLGDLNKLEEILSTVKKYSKKQYTSAKVRLGVNEKIPVEIGKAVEACGVDFVSVHGRTRAGKYKAPVDYDAIKAMKEAVSIPVIANGDIKDFAKAKEVLEYTKANGIMIGRGAIGKPWVFYQLKHGIEDISDEKKKEIILEHYDAVIKFHGEHGAIMFRKLLHSYSKGYQGANEFRDIINRVSDINIMRDMIENFF
ncbi:tRNA dihydrouridine synthase DusB [Arcobacter sp. CECT 8986]|uniref:tRNA dihydrouridine synthase n=1 Tax=Arcobacter sp. CECT 8986 TaxID=2044507 RepID=UPI001009BBBA|nr:tRNA-dihydrouridine synthase [Arcobacter sp. CECT 8986]RXJ99298.1 tRNA dihydrouridine synthase DusB [Arcobacter sp. CECT 8986]